MSAQSFPADADVKLDTDLSGRIAIVTGASRRSGIGAAICRALATAGADIFFTHWGAYDELMEYADSGGAAALQEELGALGRRVERMEADLADPAMAERILAACRERLGPPSILVNNAAHSTRDSVHQLDAATLDAHYAVNLRGTALLSVGFARSWQGGPGGRIINLTSGQDRGPMPGELAYAATKAAIAAFSRTLAAEVGPLGITVNVVNPGPTQTGWISDEFGRELLPRFALGRLGQPADAARLVCFLATDAAGWITGQTIHSDGGFN